MPIIMKFGGTSVADRKAMEQVVQIIRAARSKQPVVITSALSHITNLLLETAALAASGAKQKMSKNIENIRNRHNEVFVGFKESTRKCIGPSLEQEMLDLEAVFARIARQLKLSKRNADNAASFGERLASWLLTGALLDNAITAERIDSRDIIKTDSTFGGAEVDFVQTKKLFAKKISALIRRGVVPVITGFIGSDAEGNTTTLGRGGSDYSAAITAVCLKASEIQIWKDVKGFMTADPRLIKNAKVIQRLSFREAAELSYFGAKLLHPKTIHPAIAQNIPVRILNTFAPENPGTLIVGEPRSEISVQAIAYKKGITIINVTSLRMLGPYGFLERLFRIFSEHRVPVDVIATSEVSVSMTIEDTAFTSDLLLDLKIIGTVAVRTGNVIVSLVGCGIQDNPRFESNVFDVLNKASIPTAMISKGASSINFTFIIQEKYYKKTILRLHQKFFS